MNANYVKKSSAARTSATSSSEAVVIADLVKEFGFYAFDISDKDYLNEVYYQYCHDNNNQDNSNNSMRTSHTSDDGNQVPPSSSSTLLFPLADGSVSVIGKETHFFHYLSTCKDTYVYFDLYGESQQNKIK